MKEELVSAERAAAFLGLNVFTVYRLALKRQLPSYKLGRLRKFRKSELLEWLERHRVPEVGGMKTDVPRSILQETGETGPYEEKVCR